MKEIPFEWYEFPVEARVAMSALNVTGLKVIPGCQRMLDGEYPPGVLFAGKRYHQYSLGPFGFVVLGNESTYRQKLSRDKLFPETDQPLIIPFGEFMQVHSCDGAVGVWSFQTGDKWVITFYKVSRAATAKANRFLEYFQMVYDYTKERFSFNYKLVETGEETFIGSLTGSAITGGLRPKYEKLMNKSFVLGDEEEVIEPPIVEPEQPTEELPDPINSEWFSLFEWDDTINYYRVQRRGK